MEQCFQEMGVLAQPFPRSLDLMVPNKSHNVNGTKDACRSYLLVTSASTSNVQLFRTPYDNRVDTFPD